MNRMCGFRTILVVTGLLLACLSAYAYDRDTHYYVMCTIALDSGFSPAEAAELATLAEYVDEDGSTEPAKVLGVEQRRVYHFASGVFDTYLTIHDGRFARHNINTAFRANDKHMLSVSLHTYADSWSHETYGSVVGHLFQGHEPDRPYKRVATFMEMCRQVYTVMQWYRQVNGLPLVARRATDQDLADTAALGTECSLFSSYEDKEVTPRCANWTNTIARVFSIAAGYTPPQGTLLAAFNTVVATHTLPLRGDDCYNAHWDSPASKSGGDAAALCAAAAPRAAAPPNYDKILAKLTGKSADFIARYLAAHPDVIADPRIQALIVGQAGLDALVKQAKNEKRMRAVMRILLACDWTGIDHVPVLATNLQSSSFCIRLLSANLLAQFGSATGTIAAAVNTFYSSLDLARLSKGKTACLLDSLVLNEEHIAGCATNIVNLLGALLHNRRFAHLAAARLYTIGCQETPGTNPVAGADALRQTAFTYLRQGSISNVAAPVMLRYWQVRSYEDFDDGTNGTPADATNMFILIGEINQAVAAQDADMIQAAASAFCSYGTEDNPDPAITNTLTQALDAAPDEAKWQIGYALEQITGATFDLTPPGLADFDRQWQKRFSGR